MWAKVNRLRQYLAKDTIDVKSLFSLVEEALNDGDYETASALQIEMYDRIEELKVMYAEYKYYLINQIKNKGLETLNNVSGLYIFQKKSND